MRSFRLWLEHRLQQVPDAMTLALFITRSGAAGVSRPKKKRLSPSAITFRGNMNPDSCTGNVTRSRVYRAISDCKPRFRQGWASASNYGSIQGTWRLTAYIR